VSAFADVEVIRLATRELIPVCADDWYQRRRRDAEGAFFKKIYEQSPRRGAPTSTKQGIYLFTADGELLGFNNAGNSVEAVRGLIGNALKKFKALPEARRKPGGMIVEDFGKPDPQYSRSPPVGGAVVQVFSRILERDGTKLKKGTCDFVGGGMPGRDFLWLTSDEITAMVPQQPKLGEVSAMPAAVSRRLARFHLVDNTRGEPAFWEDADVRKAQLRLTVTKLTPETIEWSCSGEVLLATSADVTQADRGFEVRLSGTLRYRREKKVFDQWELTALGEHWGSSTYTKEGERPGRTWLGLTFQLVGTPTPAQTVPPQAARDFNRYFGRD